MYGRYREWMPGEFKAEVGDILTLRSDEAVRDLHYAIGRYLAQLPSS